MLQLSQTFQPGMYVRVNLNPANFDFKLAKIKKVNPVSGWLTLAIYSPNSKRLDGIKSEEHEVAAETVERCQLLPNTPVLFTKSGQLGEGKALISCQADFISGKLCDYYVQLEGQPGVKQLSEADLLVEGHYQNPNPAEQTRHYEFHPPIWKFSRDKILESFVPLQNSTPGLEDLVGARLQLLPHQAGVVSKVLNDPVCRYLLADEVGLGKTIEAAVILKTLLRRNPNFKVLIIAPASLVQQWYNELNVRFWLNFEIRGSIHESRTRASQLQQVITSLEDLGKESTIDTWSRIKTQKWDLIIADEVHQLYKNPLLYERISQLSQQTPRVLLLSATPIQRRQEEYLTLLALLDPQRYQLQDRSNFNKKLNEQTKVREAVNILKSILRQEELDKQEIAEEITNINFLNLFANNNRLQQLLHQIKASNQLGLVKMAALEALAYLNENYRIENRIIRNRRASLANHLRLPIRLLETSFSYKPTETEAIVLEQLYDYIDELLARQSANLLAGEYGRLLLFAAQSSPYALNWLLNKRLLAFKSVGTPLRAETDLLLPAPPRHEQERVEAVAVTVEPFDSEVAIVQQLLKRVDIWQEETTAALESFCANPLVMQTIPARHRLVQVLRALYQQNQLTKTIIFSGWTQTVEVLATYLNRLVGEKLAEFSCRLPSDELHQQASRFQRETSCKVLLCDELGGEGRNFQVAQQIIHVDLPWTPAIIEQRIGRVDRIGRIAENGKGNFITSVVPYAEQQIEADLLRIWNEAYKLFTQSMSGLEIVLENVQTQLLKSLLPPGSVRHSLTRIFAQIFREAEKNREAVEIERFHDEDDYDPRFQEEFQKLCTSYEDGQVLREAVINWCEKHQGGLPTNYNSATDILTLHTERYTPATLAQYKFYHLSDVQETLKRSERLQRNVKEIQGTFKRNLAVEREDLIFFMPGSDPFTEALIWHALEADRGRCTGVGRPSNKLSRSYYIFELFYTILLDPRPLFAAGFEAGHLARAVGYLPVNLRRLFIDFNGKLFSEGSEPVQLITSKIYNPKTDFTLNDPTNPALLKSFQEKYAPEYWNLFLNRVLKVAQNQLEKELYNNSYVVEVAQTAFATYAFGQRVGSGSAQQQAESYERISEALLQGLQKPLFQLESVCVWVLAKS